MNLQTLAYSFQRLNRFTGKMRFAGIETTWNYLIR